MFEAFVPKKKIGVLSPLAVIDNIGYEDSQLVDRGSMMVSVPLGFEQCTAEHIERVVAAIGRQLDLLLEREADIAQQAGVPLARLIATAAVQRLQGRLPEKPK